jgi:hypothetical protein
MMANYRIGKQTPFLIFLIVLIGTVVVGSVFASQDPDHGTRTATLEADHYIYLPVIQVPVTGDLYDMATYMIGDGRLYEVQTFQGPQTRFQSQTEGIRFFHTKGEPIAEWEELWATDQHIMRGTDTSPGSGNYYTLRDPGIYGSAWSPRYWRVGDIYERNPLVTFYTKNDCSIVTQGWQNTFLKFEAFHSQRQFESGITLYNVIELSWLLTANGDPIEKYYYAEDYGLVGWWSNDRSFSYISEEHDPGTRPDNNREVIGCLDTGALTNWSLAQLLIGPLEPPYRAK